MDKFEGVTAAHYYAPGQEPNQYDGMLGGLTDSILTIGPAIILFLVLLLLFSRTRDKVLDRSPDRLPPEERARLEEARAAKADEVRRSVQALRKQRQQQSTV